MSLSSKLSFSSIFLFWAPLSATWLMMAAEGPLLTSLIARLSEPKYNLAAYGVATAIAMIIESPIIMMLSASIALVRDSYSYRALRGFLIKLNIMITLGMIITIIPPVFSVIAYNILHLTKPVADLMYGCLVSMICWPAAIGFRRFWQGLLIRAHLTKRVAVGTVVRLSTMFGTALLLVHFTHFSGTIIGGTSLTVGVILEALATRIMVHETIKKLLIQEEIKTEQPLTTSYMMSYYSPLALTSLIGMASVPILTVFIGRSPMSLESLAVLPIIESFVFIFRSFGFSFQEVSLALLGQGNKYYKELGRFALIIGIITTAAYSIIVYSPMVYIILSNLYGLTPDLVEFSIIPCRILFFYPFLSVSYAYFRSVLMNSKKNSSVTYSTIMEIIGMIGIVMLTETTFHPVGIITAAIGLGIGRLGAQWYLIRSFNEIVKRPILK
jgi:hypothetical protein